MNERFWNTLKVLVAVGATILIYNYLNLGSNTLDNETSVIESSMDKLAVIFKNQISDLDSKTKAEIEFKEFSAKVESGEIAPNVVEDIAASILNMRMESNIERTENLQKIILNMRKAQSSSNFDEISTELFEARFDTIAFRIIELTNFQDELFSEIISSENFEDILAPVSPIIVENEGQIQIKIDFEPVSPVSAPSEPTLPRHESPVIMLHSFDQNLSPIKISDKLEIVLNSLFMEKMDSLKLIHLKEELNKLRLIKTLKNENPQKH